MQIRKHIHIRKLIICEGYIYAYCIEKECSFCKGRKHIQIRMGKMQKKETYIEKEIILCKAGETNMD